MTEITLIADHVAQALGLQVEQFKNRANFTALVTVLVNAVQEAENVVYSLLEGVTIDGAVGSQLDRLGSALGEQRLGRTDDEFRAFLRVKILLNVCDGDPETIIQILVGLVGATDVQVLELYPAKLQVWFNGDVNVLGDPGVQAIMKLAKAAGVGLFLYQSQDGPGLDSFSFGSVADDGPDPDHGFSGVANPAAGGKLARVVSLAPPPPPPPPPAGFPFVDDFEGWV